MVWSLAFLCGSEDLIASLQLKLLLPTLIMEVKYIIEIRCPVQFMLFAKLKQKLLCYPVM